MRRLLPVFVAVVALAQQPTLADIATELRRLADQILALAETHVPSGGNLQAALTRGGTIHLAASGTYTGNFVARVPGTRLRCNGARLIGQRGHALLVPSGAGVRDIQIDGCAATTDYDQAVIRLGANDSTQTRLEDEPSDLVLTNIVVPTHRGKRAIEVNARNVTIAHLTVEDLWDPAGRDSQAIAVLNSSGAVTIHDATLTAGSEVIMIGGDTIKLAGIQTSNITIDNVVLARPLSWRTDGINRAVKNLLELKAGIDVTIRNVRMRGSWAAAQTGEAIVITPRDRRVVDNVLIEDVDIADVASGLQILGRDYTSFTDGALDLTIRRMRLSTTSGFGGHGRVATVSGEPASIVIRDSTLLNHGETSLYIYDGSVMHADGTTRRGGPIGRFEMVGNRARRGVNGLFLGGYANGGTLGQGLAILAAHDVSGNTWGGDSSASVLQRNFPTNTYLSRAAFDALIGAGQ